MSDEHLLNVHQVQGLSGLLTKSFFFFIFEHANFEKKPVFMVRDKQDVAIGQERKKMKTDNTDTSAHSLSWLYADADNRKHYCL